MNIAEILKYCNKGTKLYSTIFGDVYFQRVLDKYLIEVTSNCGVVHQFFPNGSYSLQGECVLFPSKKQHDWSKFRLSVKRGDIMMIIDGTSPFIAAGELYNNISPKYICGINSSGEFIKYPGEGGWTSEFYIPASEEAKKELFDKIAESGYKWNADTLELEKIEPKYRPFKNKKECWEEMQKHKPFGWITDGPRICNIICIREDGILANTNFNGTFYEFESSINLKFADGTPFGINE